MDSHFEGQWKGLWYKSIYMHVCVGEALSVDWDAIKYCFKIKGRYRRDYSLITISFSLKWNIIFAYNILSSSINCTMDYLHVENILHMWVQFAMLWL